jgi:holin-like protein
MHPSRILSRLRPVLHRSRVLQIALLIGFWVLGEQLTRLSSLPVPGGVIGMAIVLALLASRRLSPFSLRRGAYWLLAEMLLFFVPAVMAILDHGELAGALGLKLLAVILPGTLLVMGGTALTVDLCYRSRARHALD